jgi:membrane fusion protein (multidrug efflux system)
VDKARLDYQSALASLQESEANKRKAEIDKRFTQITAPFSGYLSRIPYKIGSLVDNNSTAPLTTISKTDTVYAYFSMSEIDFSNFKKNYEGGSIEEKIEGIPPVNLKLAGGLDYDLEGKIDMVDGQFNTATGSITLRASFPNPNGLIRSGNTGTVVLHRIRNNTIAIPKSATYELQDKTIVYKVDSTNYVQAVPIEVSLLDNENYQVTKGLNFGDIIVERGIDRLKDSLRITPIQKSRTDQ